MAGQAVIRERGAPSKKDAVPLVSQLCMDMGLPSYPCPERECGNPSACATLHPQASILPRVAVLTGMGLQKRQKQPARKPVGAHSDSDCSFSLVTCCSGIMRLERGS